MKLRAHHGVNAVGADKNVSRNFDRAAVAPAKERDYSARRLREADKPVPFADSVGTRALTNGRQHDAMQHAAMDGVLRKFVPGIAAAEFGNDVLAELVDVAKFPRLDADRLDRIDDIELRQFTNRMWQDVDPHTQRFQLLGDIEGDELDAAPL